MSSLSLDPKVLALAEQAERDLEPVFARIDAIARENTARVMAAFRQLRVSASCLVGTTGYGYDDRGREVLESIYARVFGAEDALVRINFVNGTPRPDTALFGVLRPGDVMVSCFGAPYDTLQTRHRHQRRRAWKPAPVWRGLCSGRPDPPTVFRTSPQSLRLSSSRRSSWRCCSAAVATPAARP